MPVARLGRLVLAVVLLVVYLEPVTGAQSLARLTGAVSDVTGRRLANALVSVRGAVDRDTWTANDGSFDVDGLPEGRYEITASLRGFAVARVEVRLPPGENRQIPLTLSVQHLEQVVVTAPRLGESDLQATPMAVSVLTPADLASTQAHTIGQLAGRAPSVTFSQNSDFAQLTIRGIGSNVVFAGSDPSSAVYLDGVYLARPVMITADLLDIERVEVLRGPQGTLYGRNAVGGAINLVTRAPSRELEASGDLTAGTFNTWRAQGRVSGPIVADRVMASGAFLRGVRNGFVRDVQHPEHALGGEDVLAVRGQMQIVGGPRLGVLVSGDWMQRDPVPLTYAKVLAVKPGFTVDNPDGLHNVRTSTPATSDVTHHGGSARVTWSMTPATTLTSLTASRRLDYELLSDADITELELVTSHVHETQRQFSQEVTLAHKRRRATWLAGAFLFEETDHQPTVVGLGGPRLVNLLRPYVNASASALFGQASIDLRPRVSITAGLRYSDERKRIDNAGRLSTMDAPVTVVSGSAYEYTDRIAYSAWTPRVALDWRPRDHVLAYASAARGFKSGGFNLTSNEPGRGYAPESAWSYEGGLKTDIASGRARLNVSAFHTDYTDLQVQTPIRPGVLDISNAAAATIRGVETEGSIRLTRAAGVGGHLAWLDARYDRYIAVGAGGVTGDVAGHRLSNAPHWSGALWIDWSRHVGVHELGLRAESRWQTTVFFTPFNDALQRQQAYAVFDAAVHFTPRAAHWSVAAYARNLANQNYIIGTFSSPPPAIGGRPGEPRNIGVQLRVHR